MTEVERIIIRINELGLAMGVEDGVLFIEGDTRGLTEEDRANLKRLKPDLIEYLSAPCEHVAIMCKYRQPDGRACGEIVTVQRPSGKVAWCQTCYGQGAVERQAGDARSGERNSGPCHSCGCTDFWTSVYGKRICRACHPPVCGSEVSDEQGGAKKVAVARSSSFPSADDHIVTNEPHVVLPLRKPKPAHPQPARSVMYVAMDLEHWITDEPHIWSDAVEVNGKKFLRLTPTVAIWLRQRVEAACKGDSLSVEAFGRIVRAFDRVYSFAVRTGLVRPSAALARELARLEAARMEGAA